MRSKRNDKEECSTGTTGFVIISATKILEFRDRCFSNISLIFHLKQPKLTAKPRKDDSFGSGESVDLSRNDSPRSNNSLEDMLDGRNRSSTLALDGGLPERSSSVCSSVVNMRTSRTDSVVEELLSDIYDGRWHSSIDSDFDGAAGNAASAFAAISVKKYTERELMAKDKAELKCIIKELQHRVQQTNSRLLRQLKTRAKKRAVIQTNCNVVTACLQAKSLKREVGITTIFTNRFPLLFNKINRSLCIK